MKLTWLCYDIWVWVPKWGTKCCMDRWNCQSSFCRMLFWWYSQTYSNNHLYKTTNIESAQASFHTVVCVQDDCVSNMTSNHFFGPQMKKMSEMTTTNLYLAKKWETIHYKGAFKRYIYSKFWIFGTPPSPCSYLFTLHVPPPSTYIPFSELLPLSQQKLYGIYEFINEQFGSEKTK